MKRLLTILTTITIAFAGLQVMAQREMNLPEYHFNPASYNPAYAGTTEYLSLATSYLSKWVGIKGAPRVINLNAHSPISYKNLSAGIGIFQNKIALTSITSLYIDAAYYIQINEKNDRISFGLRAGTDFLSTNYTELHGKTDKLKENLSETKANVGAGIYYYNKKYFAGISALSLTNSKLIEPNYNIYGGYLFDINPNIKLRPTAMIKISEETVFDLEIATNIYKKAWIAVGYQTNNSIKAYTLFNATTKLSIGYNYTYMSANIGKYAGGTHQLSLAYQFKSKLFAKEKQQD